MWLALWFCPMHPKIRSARQKQTENTHILGKKLKKVTLIAVPMDCRMERANYENTMHFRWKMKILRFFHRKCTYSTIALNFSVKLTERKLSGKIEWNISFVYLDKAKYKSEEAFRAHKVFQNFIKSQGFQNCYKVKTSTWCSISYNTLLIVHILTSLSR